MGRSGVQSMVVVLISNLIFILSLAMVPYSSAADKTGAFEGTWVANGSKETLSLGADRSASLFRLAGHVNLKNEVGQESDYWSECIGLTDSETGSSVRCTWTTLKGDKIFLVLEGQRLSEGSQVTGKMIGGTGSVSGITGNITLKWSTMSAQHSNDEDVIGGYAKEFRGTYKLP